MLSYCFLTYRYFAKSHTLASPAFILKDQKYENIPKCLIRTCLKINQDLSPEPTCLSCLITVMTESYNKIQAWTDVSAKYWNQEGFTLLKFKIKRPAKTKILCFSSFYVIHNLHDLHTMCSILRLYRPNLNTKQYFKNVKLILGSFVWGFSSFFRSYIRSDTWLVAVHSESRWRFLCLLSC